MAGRNGLSELLMWSSARLAVAGGERSSGIAEGGVKLFYSEVRPPRIGLGPLGAVPGSGGAKARAP